MSTISDLASNPTYSPDYYKEDNTTAVVRHIHCFCTINTAGDPMCCKCLRTKGQILSEIRQQSIQKYDEAWKELSKL